MAAEESDRAPPAGTFSHRMRERIGVWRRVFVSNWNLFKASRIGVIGLAIMVAFVILALAAPFMGLRDPIRWTAPDEDLISTNHYWTKDSTTPGSELMGVPKIDQPIAFRLSVEAFDSKANRLYVAAGNRLYAFVGEPGLKGRNAWGAGNYFDVSSARTITAEPIVVNLGHFTESPKNNPDILADYELYLGTSDGALFLVRDTGDQTPFGANLVARMDLAGGAITGIAAYNGDLTATYQTGATGEIPAVLGYPNYASYNATERRWDRTVLPSTGDDGEYGSLALNATGSPVMAYYSVWRGEPQVHVLTGQGWKSFSTTPLEPYSEMINTGQYTSLALNATGSPAVAYYDATEKDLKYAQWNGSAWVSWNGTGWNTPVLPLAWNGDVGQYASLALTSSNLPRIAYYNATDGNLTYSSFNGTKWTNETVDSYGDVGQYASLALDGAGDAHIAYYDATNRSLRYVAQVAGVWQAPEVVDRGNVGQYASLALNATGSPSIAYYDATNRSLRYVAQVAGVWQAPEVVDRGNVGQYASLALNATGSPAIAYYDAFNLRLKYAHSDASGIWRNETVISDGFSGKYNSLKFDAAGTPHIATYSFQVGRTTRDMLVVGTESGKVYGIDLGYPKEIDALPRANQVASWDYRVRWVVDLGSAIHIAGTPMVGPTNVPVYSPAFDANGTQVFVGTAGGQLVSLRTSDGLAMWTRRIGPSWSTAPIVEMAAEGPETGNETVYAASDRQTADDPNTSVDETGWSLLFALNAKTGRPIWEWGHAPEFEGFGGAAPIGPCGQAPNFCSPPKDPDGGNLTQPGVFGDTIYLGSTSGYIYAIRRDQAGSLPPASLRWYYQDAVVARLGYKLRFTDPLFVAGNNLLLLVDGNHDNGTPNDPTDDKGVLYSIKFDGTLSWKKTFDAPLRGHPISWKPPSSLDDNVWVVFANPQVTGVTAYATTGQFLAPSSPSWAHSYACPTQDDKNKVCPGYPSGNQYWLGLDSQGRDIFSQVVWGSRIALLVGFLSALFTVVLGVVVGLVAGYVGGKVESILMRFTDVILVLPSLPLIITLAAVLGASIWNIILVISLLGWPGVARIIRAEVLSLKERPFIDSARVTGASTTRIVFRHIAPNVMPLAFLYMTFSVSGAILTEAALSFIGLGDVNTMSWGIMLQLVSQSKALTAWYWLLPPGLAITMISLAFFLVGRAFDEIVNPRLRKR